jgi:hypothetical protein
MGHGFAKATSYPSYGGLATNGWPHFLHEKVLGSDSMLVIGWCLIKGFKYAVNREGSLAGADSFGVEQGKAQEVVEWMNAYAKKNNQKFEARLSGYAMQTTKFGIFEMITWSGEWSAARNIIKKTSGKVGAKVIESGYHEKRDLLTAMFGSSSEFGKVYSNGKLVGQIETVKKSGRWTSKAESFA